MEGMDGGRESSVEQLCFEELERCLMHDENPEEMCTHRHICNPPGPDLPHSHTCVHVHTKEVPVCPQDKAGISKKRPCGGNREAVKRYREKKKAQATSLEDENRRLREQNHQLLAELHLLKAVENENKRLKYLLVDLGGRIDAEIGHFPYLNPIAHHASACVGTPPSQPETYRKAGKPEA